MQLILRFYLFALLLFTSLRLAAASPAGFEDDEDSESPDFDEQFETVYRDDGIPVHRLYHRHLYRKGPAPRAL
jgi:hypothetical protein